MKKPCKNLTALLVALFALAGGAAPSLAQTGVVQGQVVDAKSRRPLSDAQISIEGTGIGQLAAVSGRFVLLGVPAGERVLRVALIGYEESQQTISVGAGQTVTVDVELSSTAISLDEIVVTGVGAETTRRALGASVEVIAAEEIALAPVQSVDQLLQGRVPGATVSATSAQPGTGSLINFRGISSVFNSQTPVIYVDGVRVDNDQSTAGGTGGEQSSALSDLLTADIEKIEVTKGGAASTLFGSDAATGVIQIFTKKGTPGAPRITGRVEQGIELPELKYIFDTRLTFPDEVASGEVTGTFMEDNYFQRGTTQNYYAGVTGGTADVTYNISGRLETRTGTQPKDGSTNYSLRGGMQASLNDDFSLEFSGSYVRHNFDRLYNGTAIADPLTTFEVADALFFSRAETLEEALDIFLMPDITEYVNRFIFSAGARWDIRDDLNARLTVGADNRSNQQRRYQPIGFTPGEATGQLNRWDRDFTSVSLEAGTTHRWASPGDALELSTSIGVQGFREDETIISAFGRTFALPGTFDFDAAATRDAVEGNVEVFNGGIYFDEQVGLWDKIYVGAGFRIDAGSSFGDAIDTEFFPKATASYVLSEDLRFGFMDEFKLRAAYGQTGSFPGAFLKDRTFFAIPFRNEAAAGFANPGNDGLGPEKTSTIEAGFDAALFSNRLGMNFTWYDARTTDALFQVPRQPVTGQGTQQENVGEIWNWGIEAAVNLLVLNRRDLAWSVGGNFQYNYNEVTDMGGVAPFSVDGSQKRVTEGMPVGAWWVTTPSDTDGDGLPDASSREFTGGIPVPNKSGGVNTTVSVGDNLTISALADWAGGHQVFDWGSVWSTFNGIYRRESVRCGTEEGALDECEYAFPVRYQTANNGATPRGRYSQNAARSAFLYDGDYFKLREVAVRYVLPEDVSSTIKARRATVYATGRNLWIWSRNVMVDGELNGIAGGGLDLGGETSITLPPNRIFRLGMEVVF